MGKKEIDEFGGILHILGDKYMIITKKMMYRLSKPYIEQEMSACYAESQSLASTSSKVILLLNDTKLIILFLNFTSSKVIHKIDYNREELVNKKIKNGAFLDIVWSFSVENTAWRFRIMKKIVTLDKMQMNFINKLK